ncbi:MAG: asparagine synthase (glutamine-hydrolyzing) [Anditalea sp.]
MCGINLVLNHPEKGEEAIQKMMNASRHRGPDHSAWLKAAPGIYVAGSRLKILDLGEAGNQPVTTEDGKAVLVWNGALYNYQDLRNELLGKGVVFGSRSDSEVLIHWLKLFGEEGVKQLQGMFAFAFVDKEKGKVIVGRDPYGKKPLYFNHQNDQWLFSSEARAIVLSGVVMKRMDVSQYVPYFYSRHTFPDLSFFKGIGQVMPGTVMAFDFTGHHYVSISLEINREQVDLPSVTDFREMILDAVLKHFHADVPVGMILSGGADSSLLLHSWHQETGIPLNTFTAAFDPKYQGKYSDPKFASALAANYHCIHHKVWVTPEIVFENWGEYISSLDQPIGDSASFLTWLIAKEAKKHVKVLVSGAGADELFSGYDRHMAFRYYLKNPSLFRSLAKWILLSPLLPRRIKKILNAITDSAEGTYLNFSSLQSIPFDIRNDFLAYYPKDTSPYKAALSWDREYFLVNDVLKIHDNATMAHGLEGRAPFMDESLVALSNSLSEEQHILLEPKQWIKMILKEDGLEEIASRKKLGFGLPLKEWFETDQIFRERIFLAIQTFEVASGTDFPEDMRKLARHPEEHIQDSFLQIWNLFILASWKVKQGL